MNRVQNFKIQYVTFASDTVFIDFEITIHKAVCAVWVEAEIKGCRFHFSHFGTIVVCIN
jgi:hypothetical protein